MVAASVSSSWERNGLQCFCKSIPCHHDASGEGEMEAVMSVRSC